MGQPGSARMVTPEAVALEFQTANVGSRILAYVIDMAVVVAGIFAGLFAVALLGQATDLVVPDWVAITIVLVLLPSWWLGYFIAFETLWRGRTLGKAALGLRVVTTEGAPVRFRHAAIRALLGLVDFAIASGFFAVVFILLTGRAGAGQLRRPRRAGGLHRHPGHQPAHHRGVPGGADLPAAGREPAARPPRGAGAAARRPAGRAAAAAAAGRHLAGAVPALRRRRPPAAPAPGHARPLGPGPGATACRAPGPGTTGPGATGPWPGTTGPTGPWPTGPGPTGPWPGARAGGGRGGRLRAARLTPSDQVPSVQECR